MDIGGCIFYFVIMVCFFEILVVVGIKEVIVSVVKNDIVIIDGLEGNVIIYLIEE